MYKLSPLPLGHLTLLQLSQHWTSAQPNSNSKSRKLSVWSPPVVHRSRFNFPYSCLSFPRVISIWSVMDIVGKMFGLSVFRFVSWCLRWEICTPSFVTVNVCSQVWGEAWRWGILWGEVFMDEIYVWDEKRLDPTHQFGSLLISKQRSTEPKTSMKWLFLTWTIN